MPNSIDELLNRPIPEKLWHYTSIKGFYGIVTSKSIFATELRYLNDREEFIHTKKLAEDIVREAPELDEYGFPNREWLSRAARLTLDAGPLSKQQVFVASFTAAEDQLGRWRAYSHTSSGVSIGFDLRAIRPAAASETVVSFAPCVYEADAKKVLLLQAFQHHDQKPLVLLGFWWAVKDLNL